MNGKNHPNLDDLSKWKELSKSKEVTCIHDSIKTICVCIINVCVHIHVLLLYHEEEKHH